MISKIILNLYFWPLFGLITLAAMALAPPLLLINRLMIRMTPERFVRIGVRIYGRVLISSLFPMVRVRVEDHRGPINGPVVYAANHLSAIDPYLFGVLSGDNGFVTTWPFKIPLYNRFMKICSYIDASRGWEHVQREGLRMLGQGCSLIIWPEGHRSRDGRTRRFKNGAFVIADLARVPVVPVCIRGSEKVLPPGARFLTPGVVTVSLLEPVFPEGPVGAPETIHRLKHRVRERIIRALEGPKPKPALKGINAAMEGR